jgi:hypothetical protein
MDAVIKLKPEELDNKLLVKIKELIGGRQDKDTITFTMEEFLAYPSKSV